MESLFKHSPLTTSKCASIKNDRRPFFVLFFVFCQPIECARRLQTNRIWRSRSHSAHVQARNRNADHTAARGARARQSLALQLAGGQKEDYSKEGESREAAGEARACST